MREVWRARVSAGMERYTKAYWSAAVTRLAWAFNALVWRRKARVFEAVGIGELSVCREDAAKKRACGRPASQALVEAARAASALGIRLNVGEARVTIDVRIMGPHIVPGRSCSASCGRCCPWVRAMASRRRSLGVDLLPLVDSKVKKPMAAKAREKEEGRAAMQVFLRGKGAKVQECVWFDRRVKARLSTPKVVELGGVGG